MVRRKPPLFWRPYDSPWLTYHILTRDQPKVSGIIAIIAVVTHHEIFTSGDMLQRHISAGWFFNIGFLQCLSVDIYYALPDLNCIAGYSNDSLYQVFFEMYICRWTQYHHVS